MSHEEKRCNTDDLKFETSLITTYTTPTTRQKKNRLSQGALSEHGSDPPCPGEFSCPNLDPTCISPTGHFDRMAPDLWDQNDPNLSESDFASNIYGNCPGPLVVPNL